MAGIVLGLVEAGSDGLGEPRDPRRARWRASPCWPLFVHIETRAEEPILPLRLLANATRTTANVSRGLVYAGMYGMFFFLGQFLQDVAGVLAAAGRRQLPARSRPRCSCPRSW